MPKPQPAQSQGDALNASDPRLYGSRPAALVAHRITPTARARRCLGRLDPKVLRALILRGRSKRTRA